MVMPNLRLITSTSRTRSSSSATQAVSEDPSCDTATDNLEVIDEELRSLHQFCIEQEYDPRLIGSGASELWTRLRHARRRRWMRRVLLVSVVVGLVAALVQCDSVCRLATAYTRLATIKMLPYWDWTAYYKDGCFLFNPYFEESSQELEIEDCKICEGTVSLQRLSNLSHSTMTSSFIKADIPLVITDALDDWPVKKSFTLQFLYELYVTDNVMNKIPPCMFVSNVPLQLGNAKVFLKKVYEGEIASFYAHWENCDKTAVRLLRQFFRRPYFLPPMIEVADKNWILISSYFSAKNYKPLDLATPLMWLVQLRGENKIRLVPRAPCNTTCSTMYTVLHEGEILVWTDFMWLVDYMPINLGPRLNVAVMSGGYFD